VTTDNVSATPTRADERWLVPLHKLAFGVFGPPGSGKSTIPRTLPGRGFVLNTLPAEVGAPIVLASAQDRIHICSISQWGQLGPVLKQLELGRRLETCPVCREALPVREGKGPGVDWFALDSFTGLGVLARKRALGERAARGINADPALMSIRDWGNMGGFLYEALVQLLGIPLLKLLIAQERPWEEQGNKIGPDTRPPVIGFLCQSVNGMGRLYSAPVGGGVMERRMRVMEHPLYMTKWQLDSSRWEGWPNIIRNPDLGKIIRYAYGPAGRFPPPDGVDEVVEAAADNNAGMQALEIAEDEIS